jgi:hypothetical protein
MKNNFEQIKADKQLSIAPVKEQAGHYNEIIKKLSLARDNGTFEENKQTIQTLQTLIDEITIYVTKLVNTAFIQKLNNAFKNTTNIEDKNIQTEQNLDRDSDNEILKENLNFLKYLSDIKSNESYNPEKLTFTLDELLDKITNCISDLQKKQLEQKTKEARKKPKPLYLLKNFPNDFLTITNNHETNQENTKPKKPKKKKKNPKSTLNNNDGVLQELLEIKPIGENNNNQLKKLTPIPTTNTEEPISQDNSEKQNDCKTTIADELAKRVNALSGDSQAKQSTSPTIELTQEPVETDLREEKNGGVVIDGITIPGDLTIFLEPDKTTEGWDVNNDINNIFDSEFALTEEEQSLVNKQILQKQNQANMKLLDEQINNLPHQANNHNEQYIMTVKITYPNGIIKLEGDIEKIGTRTTHVAPSGKLKSD